ncbi:MAG TPA: GNAT family N-acetyltransferase, partial [Candidatus Limnocylindrales bacterium]
SMTADDYDPVVALWRAAEGIGLSEADQREAIAAYLERNPGLSLVAIRGDALVGALFCGHDGRRGYLHHVVVARSERGHGLGREMVRRALDGLGQLGIVKANIFVYADNAEGQSFWRATGWTARDDLMLMQHDIEPRTEAG